MSIVLSPLVAMVLCTVNEFVCLDVTYSFVKDYCFEHGYYFAIMGITVGLEGMGIFVLCYGDFELA